MSKFSEYEKPEKSKNLIKEQKRQRQNEDFTKTAQIHQNKQFSYKQLEVFVFFILQIKNPVVKVEKEKI